MPRPDRSFDWHRVAEFGNDGDVVDSRARIRWLLIGFFGMAALVAVQLAVLEWRDGARYRQIASQPIARHHHTPGLRGRILARDGTVLAEDQRVVALAMHYRYLEHEPNPTWLRRTARLRLSAEERRDSQRLAQAELDVRKEREALQAELARLCGISLDEWQHRTARIEARVSALAERVNQHHQARHAAAHRGESIEPQALQSTGPWWRRAWSLVVDALRGEAEVRPPERITVVEELDYHVLVEDLPLAIVSEIESHPDRYPGVRIVEQPVRHYPAGELAAHLIGHLGAPVAGDDVAGASDYAADQRVGRMGAELQYESLLRGRPGESVERTDRSGQLVSTSLIREPEVGRDIVLSIDRHLQQTAETLLDQALERRLPSDDGESYQQAGGAIVALDVRTGEILAAASAPRFDPNWFASSGDADRLVGVLSDPDDPLYDRATRMTIPPGSVYKIVSAVALLEAGGLDPQAAFDCQGYLRQPDRLRCALYARQGIGHGDTDLASALAESCNVYFFHHAAEMGPAALVDWSLRLGFGQATGVDLPEESSGVVPTPANIRTLEDHTWRTADTQSLAIGQGSLTVTPLQVARLMAAVANDGFLVTPRLLSHLALPRDADALQSDSSEPTEGSLPRRVASLSAATLAAVREGLERAVADPEGTAHAGAYLADLPWAGKTGTAETGGERNDHAWIAGYAPLERPRVAFVVALQHAGGGGAVAGPVARRLVQRLDELGHLTRRRTAPLATGTPVEYDRQRR